MKLFGTENIENDKYAIRREVVFLVLAGLFLGSLTMLNILGVSRFVDLSFPIGDWQVPLFVAVGVLPYPITFLCTDFISELYGKRRASLVVWTGLILNLWVLFILWLGGALDQPDNLQSNGRLPVELSENGDLPNSFSFYEIRFLTFGATAASMIAYLVAQFVDVHVFHYIKKKTKGKKLWLRNNGSTLVSQLVDSVAVILITYYYADGLPKDGDGKLTHSLMFFIFSSYLFKMAAALIDTIPFYYGTKFLSKYLNIDPNANYKEDQSKE
jgi:uncharacterized PurR-regulated membrane protein YhhQ (DUF165 family)